MCSGALIVSGVATVVMGARPNPGEGRYGPYSMEQLFEQAGSKIEILAAHLLAHLSHPPYCSVLLSDAYLR